MLAFASLLLAFAGCGGGSSSSSSPASSSSSTASFSSSPASSESGSTVEPSAQFVKKKGDNTIAKFGREGSAEEREAANAVVVENLEAREDADFATQCETLTLALIKELNGGRKSRSKCPRLLKELAEPLSKTKKIRTDTLSGSITALRVKGREGYALYHGNDGKNYALPLEKENGHWRVNSLQTTEI
jgi:hypothetical protein